MDYPDHNDSVTRQYPDQHTPSVPPTRAALKPGNHYRKTELLVKLVPSFLDCDRHCIGYVRKLKDTNNTELQLSKP